MYYIHDDGGEARGTMVYAEDAAAVLALLGPGATVRTRGGRVLYTEGIDGSAGDSYDDAARVILVNEEG